MTIYTNFSIKNQYSNSTDQSINVGHTIHGFISLHILEDFDWWILYNFIGPKFYESHNYGEVYGKAIDAIITVFCANYVTNFERPI